jgi:hypothetical protein
MIPFVDVLKVMHLNACREGSRHQTRRHQLSLSCTARKVDIGRCCALSQIPADRHAAAARRRSSSRAVEDQARLDAVPAQSPHAGTAGPGWQDGDMPSPSCIVLHCSDQRSDPNHEVSTPEDGTEWQPRPMCAEHWLRVNGGEPWLWVPGRRLKGAGSTLSGGCILMGDELAGYGLVVDADVRMNSGELFSPDLIDGQQTPTLSIDGRVFGADQHIAIELVLTAQTARRLKEALRFFRS